MPNKSTLFKLLQIVIAIGIVSILFWHTDLSKIKELVYQAIPIYLVLAFLMLSGQIIVVAYRWLLVMRLAGFSLPIWQCIGSFAASSLINTTLPVAIGGDIMRMWVTSRHNISSSVAVYTVLSDRILNTLGLGLLITSVMLPSIIVIGQPIYTTKINMIALAFSIMLLALFVGLLLTSPTARRYKIHVPTLLSPIIHLSDMCGLILKYPKQLFVLLSIIMLGHFMLILSTMLLAYGLKIPLSFTQALISIPIALFFSAFPVTPGGWGVREGTMVLVLRQFNVPMESALGISILFGVGSILGSVPTATSWLIGQYFFKKTNQTIINGAAE